MEADANKTICPFCVGHGRYTLSGEISSICSDCRHARKTVMCCRCQGSFQAREMALIDYTTMEIVCRYCYDCNGTSVISGYRDNPVRMFFDTSYVSPLNTKLFMGIELEVLFNRSSTGDDQRSLLNQIKSKTHFFKYDGSLSNGFELVTHPMTYEYIKKHNELLSYTLRTMSEAGCTSYDTDECGIHIHVSRSAISTMTLWKILTFVRKNKKFILDISQRKKKYLYRWSSLRPYSTKSGVIRLAKDKRSRNRYCAVNLVNSETIEFRIFRGTLNISSFMKNVEFIHSLIQWASTSSAMKITLLEYCKYVSSNMNEYKNLYKYMSDKGLLVKPKTRQKKLLTITGF